MLLGIVEMVRESDPVEEVNVERDGQSESVDSLRSVRSA
jgi:hypothetical protein